LAVFLYFEFPNKKKVEVITTSTFSIDLN